MWDVNRRECFCQKNLYKCAKHGFELKSHSMSGNTHKEKVLCTAVSKEGHADSLLIYERTHHYWFPWKRCNCKQCFLLPIPLAKITLFIEWPSYLILKHYTGIYFQLYLSTYLRICWLYSLQRSKILNCIWGWTVLVVVKNLYFFGVKKWSPRDKFAHVLLVKA